MKNHKEMFESFLAGETLVSKEGAELKLEDGQVCEDGRYKSCGLSAPLWEIKPRTTNQSIRLKLEN